VSDWMYTAEKQTEALTKAFLKMDNQTDLLVNLILVGLLPGFGEELFFRGVMQPLFYRLGKNHHLAIWSTAIIFSAMHMQFLGFIPRLLLGVALGYIRYWTGSLWASVFAHSLNNCLAVYLHFLIQKNLIDSHTENLGAGSNEVVWVLISAFFSILSLSLIQAWSRKQDENDQALGNGDTLI